METLRDKEERLLTEFLMEYMDKYDPGMVDYMLRYFSDPFGKKCDIVSSVRSYLNLDLYEEDRYKYYFDHLKSRYDLTGNILEVASGPFPTMSKYVDDYQKEKGKGTIETYDPLLVTKRLGSIILNKQSFTSHAHISDKNMAFAMAPCDFTLEFIRIMELYNKPFSVFLCPCFDNNTYQDQDEYVSTIIGRINETKKENETVEVSYLDVSYDYPTPIISKYKKG